MKFIDRKKEIECLLKLKQLANKKLVAISIYGTRRIGKTRLARELIKQKVLYFFANKNKSSFDLLAEYCQILKINKIIGEYENLPNWDAFFEVLINRYSGIIIFDEFQNFYFVEKSVFGIIQKTIDLNEDKPIFFIFTGSTIGLMKNIFSSKESLWGRISQNIKLNQMDLSSVAQMCSLLNINDINTFVELYAVFGGFPKYYIQLENEDACKNSKDIFEKYFFDENAQIENEIYSILLMEFGSRSGVYYSILEAVARGKNTLSKIADYIKREKTSITRQINELVDYFEFLATEKPVVYSKKTIYKINHPLLGLWFAVFQKNISLYKSRNKKFMAISKSNIVKYISFRFIDLAKQFLIKKNLFDFTPLERNVNFRSLTGLTKIGRHWGKIPKAPKGQNTYEIDLIALNEEAHEIGFFECK